MRFAEYLAQLRRIHAEVGKELDLAPSTLLLLVDLTPSEGGSVGQIISYTHDPDAMQYEAAAFEDLLDVSMTMIASDPEELLRAC